MPSSMSPVSSPSATSLSPLAARPRHPIVQRRTDPATQPHTVPGASIYNVILDIYLPILFFSCLSLPGLFHSIATLLFPFPFFLLHISFPFYCHSTSFLFHILFLPPPYPFYSPFPFPFYCLLTSICPFLPLSFPSCPGAEVVGLRLDLSAALPSDSESASESTVTNAAQRWEGHGWPWWET